MPVKKAGCWFVGGDDLTGALHDLTSIVHSSNKIQYGDILVLATDLRWIVLSGIKLLPNVPTGMEGTNSK